MSRVRLVFVSEAPDGRFQASASDPQMTVCIVTPRKPLCLCCSARSVIRGGGRRIHSDGVATAGVSASGHWLRFYEADLFDQDGPDHLVAPLLGGAELGPHRIETCLSLVGVYFPWRHGSSMPADRFTTMPSMMSSL